MDNMAAGQRINRIGFKSPDRLLAGIRGKDAGRKHSAIFALRTPALLPTLHEAIRRNDIVDAVTGVLFSPLPESRADCIRRCAGATLVYAARRRKNLPEQTTKLLFYAHPPPLAIVGHPMCAARVFRAVDEPERQRIAVILWEALRSGDSSRACGAIQTISEIVYGGEGMIHELRYNPTAHPWMENLLVPLGEAVGKGGASGPILRRANDVLVMMTDVPEFYIEALAGLYAMGRV